MAEVLIVDDEANNRLLLATLLEHAGHQPLEAANSAEALAILAEHEPALIVVDLSLPGISGIDLIKRLRADRRTAKTAIALYTATALDAAAEELRELYGVCAVIPKPGDPRDILALFGTLLG